MKHRYTVESIETMRNEEMNMMNRREKINKSLFTDIKYMVDVILITLLYQDIVQHHADISGAVHSVRCNRSADFPFIYAKIIVKPCKPDDNAILVFQYNKCSRV